MRLASRCTRRKDVPENLIVQARGVEREKQFDARVVSDVNPHVEEPAFPFTGVNGHREQRAGVSIDRQMSYGEFLDRTRLDPAHRSNESFLPLRIEEVLRERFVGG
jgi:hypothetical protein